MKYHYALEGNCIYNRDTQRDVIAVTDIVLAHNLLDIMNRHGFELESKSQFSLFPEPEEVAA